MLRQVLFAVYAAIVLQLTAAWALADPPPAAVVKVTEYTLADGRKIGVQEWATFGAAVPCEVQGNRTAQPCQKCSNKPGGCDCWKTGGCPCEAAPKSGKSAAMSSLSPRLEAVLAMPALHQATDGTLTQMTTLESVSRGGKLSREFVVQHGLTADEVETIHDFYLPRVAMDGGKWVYQRNGPTVVATGYPAPTGPFPDGISFGAPVKIAGQTPPNTVFYPMNVYGSSVYTPQPEPTAGSCTSGQCAAPGSRSFGIGLQGPYGGGAFMGYQSSGK